MIKSKNLRKGLQQLCMMQPFWGTLALHMEFQQEDKQDTLMTDGKRIFYNKEFCDSLSVGLCTFVLAHEVSHPFLHHLDRCFVPGKDPRTWGTTKAGKVWHYHPDVWNIAGDRVINLMLKNAGFQLWPKCIINEAEDKGLTTEQVYHNIMPKNPPPPSGGGKGKGNGSGSGGGKCGTCSGEGEDPHGMPGEACPDCGGSGQHAGNYDPMPKADPVIGQDIDPRQGPADDFNPQEFTEIVAKAASIAKAQGKLPASVAGMIKEATEPQYPVYMLLENFIDSSTRDDDMSWKRPHRDFLSRGVIMPSAYSDKVSHVVLCYDTSGSVPDEDLTRFHRVGGDIIRRLKPQKLTVIQCDSGVKEQFIVEVEHDRDWPSEIKSSGRGGTSFKPPFDYLKKKRITPSCLVYLTDMCGDFPEPAPYPTLWISTEKDAKGPFGQTIYFNG